MLRQLLVGVLQLSLYSLRVYRECRLLRWRRPSHLGLVFRLYSLHVYREYRLLAAAQPFGHSKHLVYVLGSVCMRKNVCRCVGSIICVHIYVYIHIWALYLHIYIHIYIIYISIYIGPFKGPFKKHIYRRFQLTMIQIEMLNVFGH